MKPDQPYWVRHPVAVCALVVAIFGALTAAVTFFDSLRPKPVAVLPEPKLPDPKALPAPEPQAPKPKPPGGAVEILPPPHLVPPPLAGREIRAEIPADIPEPFRTHLKSRTAWMGKQVQTAELVWLTDHKRWLAIAVGSNPLSKSGPKIACRLKAHAALLAAMKSTSLTEEAKLHGDAAVQAIQAFVSGDVPGLPVIGSWESPDGEEVTVLFGKLL